MTRRMIAIGVVFLLTCLSCVRRWNVDDRHLHSHLESVEIDLNELVALSELYTHAYGGIPFPVPNEDLYDLCRCYKWRTAHASSGFFPTTVGLEAKLYMDLHPQAPNWVEIPRSFLKEYHDPFSDGKPYLYAVSSRGPHLPVLIYSRGPDQDIDITLERLVRKSDGELDLPDLDLIYDPTNGSVSSGDIIKFAFFEE